jgi:hypothetical protein
MPIEYVVSPDGHFIHAIAKVPVTNQEFVDYEVAHTVDERVRQPVSELLEITRNALDGITRADIEKVIERRKMLGRPHARHRCGISVALDDARSWDLAKLYEGMAILHFPEVVIVFGDVRLARVWLGMENDRVHAGGSDGSGEGA